PSVELGRLSSSPPEAMPDTPMRIRSETAAIRLGARFVTASLLPGHRAGEPVSGEPVSGEPARSLLCHDSPVTPATERRHRQRLDQLVVDRGLAASRARAQAMILAGKVRVG